MPVADSSLAVREEEGVVVRESQLAEGDVGVHAHSEAVVELEEHPEASDWPSR